MGQRQFDSDHPLHFWQPMSHNDFIVESPGKKLPLMVANLVSESMGQDEASITLLDDKGSHPQQKAAKNVLALAILTHIRSMLKN